MCVSGNFRKGKLKKKKGWKYIAYCLLTRYYIFCKGDSSPLQPDYEDHQLRPEGIGEREWRIGTRGELAPRVFLLTWLLPTYGDDVFMLYTNQNTKNLWWPNPSWFKNYHDKPLLNLMTIFL